MDITWCLPFINSSFRRKLCLNCRLNASGVLSQRNAEKELEESETTSFYSKMNFNDTTVLHRILTNYDHYY